MISIFRKVKHRLVLLVLAIALALSSIIPAKIAIAFNMLSGQGIIGEPMISIFRKIKHRLVWLTTSIDM